MALSDSLYDVIRTMVKAVSNYASPPFDYDQKTFNRVFDVLETFNELECDVFWSGHHNPDPPPSLIARFESHLGEQEFERVKPYLAKWKEAA